MRRKNVRLPQKSKNRKSRLDKSSKTMTLAHSKIRKRFDTAWVRSGCGDAGVPRSANGRKADMLR